VTDTKVDSFTELVSGLNAQQPCQVDEVLSAFKNYECPDEASVIVFWRGTCEGGGEVPAPHANTLCELHYKTLQRTVIQGMIVCVGCGGSPSKLKHLVRDVERV
jgi:hypothetical protein